jgi:hypothetical protein
VPILPLLLEDLILKIKIIIHHLLGQYIHTNAVTRFSFQIF